MSRKFVFRLAAVVLLLSAAAIIVGVILSAPASLQPQIALVTGGAVGAAVIIAAITISVARR